ncbi:MAG: biopolymer transporter ExbD [Verrucomicrobiota bacterium]
MQFYSRPKRPLSINIVSMIDILSILLIFFIVTTTFKKAEPRVEISLPESTQGKEESTIEDPVVIFITADNQIFIGDRETTLEQLPREVEALLSQKPETRFALEADEGIQLGFFVKIMDAANAAGLNDLSLNTRKPEETP